MSNPSPKASFSPLNVVCTIFGHDYIITRKVSNHINEYKCAHCNREVTETNSGKLEPLTFKIKKVNTSLAAFVQKKMRKISAA